MASAEPYALDDPILKRFDGERDENRVEATIAKMILEGKL